MPEKKGSKYVDLRSSSDLPSFNKLIKSFEKKGIYILVHADFCNPCQNYKQTVWNDLVASNNRKAGMAGIHYDQLDKSPFSDVNIKGYPSVLYVSKNGSVKRVSNFNDSETGTVTNAMPSSDMRNKELMEKLVNSEPHEVSKLLPSMEDTMDDVIEPPFDNSASIIRSKVNTDEAINIANKPLKLNNKVSPPKMNKDYVLDSQKVSEKSPLINFDPSVSSDSNSPKQGKGSSVGGSLYTNLLNIARQKTRVMNKAKAKTMKRRKA
jgi:hypothetical protein